MLVSRVEFVRYSVLGAVNMLKNFGYALFHASMATVALLVAGVALSVMVARALFPATTLAALLTATRAAFAF